MTLPLRESRLEPSIGFSRKVDVSSRRCQTFNLLNFMESAVQGSQADGREVIAGLSLQPKTLPAKYFYDERGSLLFDQICQLLEYYPARTERAILQQFASVIAHITGPCAIAELGSGSATKTRLLLDAYQSAGYAMHYTPIDVSTTALIASSTQLLVDYPTLSIQGVVSTFEPAIARLSSLPLPASLSKRLLCFFGSTIGNLSPSACSALLSQIKTVLQAGDFFLIGIDLQKDISILETAYNDSQGITAAFNLNLLDHLNQRWQGDFDANHFSHVAFYNPEKCQIEMHLESLIAQSVRLKSLNHAVHFAAGDRLLTEISRKFEIPSFRKILHDHNLPVSQVFVDSNDWYALLLCQCVT
jgi:L-histidine Nalpha-methyltransferase